MSKKFNSIFMLLLIVVLSVVGCTQGTDNKDVDVSENTELIDMAERTVILPDKVDKVFSTSPVGTVLLYSLNPDKMVGWNYSLREGEKRYISEKYHDLPNLGGAGKESINVEEVLKVDPDLLIMMTSIDETIISQADEMQKQMGKPVFVLDGDINKLDEAYKFLGMIMGEEEKAKELAKYCNETLKNIEENVSKVNEDEKVNVYYAEGPNGLQTEPTGSWHAEVLDMVGGANVAQVAIKGDKGKSEVSMEQLLSWNPDLIISWDDERGGYYSEIFKDPSWQDIKAVKDKEVYEIPNKPFNWFDRPPSVNRILGLRWMGNLLYPDIFDYDMRDEVKEFYDKFYHYDLTEEEIDELLENSTRH